MAALLTFVVKAAEIYYKIKFIPLYLLFQLTTGNLWELYNTATHYVQIKLQAIYFSPKQIIVQIQFWVSNSVYIWFNTVVIIISLIPNEQKLIA